MKSPGYLFIKQAVGKRIHLEGGDDIKGWHHLVLVWSMITGWAHVHELVSLVVEPNLGQVEAAAGEGSAATFHRVHVGDNSKGSGIGFWNK